MSGDVNLLKYESVDLVAFYVQQIGLQDCESYLFERHLSPGISVLDMGVGGGRTTPYLSGIAGRYVGADYSQGMVNACKKRWPKLEFVHCNAIDLSRFADDLFDVVVFSFNGIDVIRDDENRAKCLAETTRVLRPGGLLIFSSHNARLLGVWPKLNDASGHQIPWRIIRAVFKSISLIIRRLGSEVRRNGQGYVYDPVHGGMMHYVSTPETMAPQLGAVGLEITEIVSGAFPIATTAAFTPWYYYVCRKIRVQ
jgi:ubiquinone/menaquinone biosynthesis C-methylase UbiE